MSCLIQNTVKSALGFSKMWGCIQFMYCNKSKFAHIPCTESTLCILFLRTIHVHVHSNISKAPVFNWWVCSLFSNGGLEPVPQGNLSSSQYFVRSCLQISPYYMARHYLKLGILRIPVPFSTKCHPLLPYQLYTSTKKGSVCFSEQCEWMCFSWVNWENFLYLLGRCLLQC